MFASDIKPDSCRSCISVEFERPAVESVRRRDQSTELRYLSKSASSASKSAEREGGHISTRRGSSHVEDYLPASRTITPSGEDGVLVPVFLFCAGSAFLFSARRRGNELAKSRKVKTLVLTWNDGIKTRRSPGWVELLGSISGPLARSP